MRMCRVPSRRHASRRSRVGDRLASASSEGWDAGITTTRDGMVRHVYDDSWQCLADIDGNGNVLRSYVWGEGIDKLLAVKIGGESYYPLTDIQGTVWGYVDSQNNIVARWMYDAWGNVLSGFCAVPSLASLRYRFQGRERSQATGLTNFRMRWYDAVAGRWLSKDPIGLSGGVNLYVLCNNIPTCNIDPVGAFSFTPTPFTLFVRPTPVPRMLFDNPAKTSPLPRGTGIPNEWKPSPNPSKPNPPPGFEFRGPPGKGSYYNPRTSESLRPDLNHPDGIRPHWDYKDPFGNWWRWFLDGVREPKPPRSFPPVPPQNNERKENKGVFRECA